MKAYIHASPAGAESRILGQCFADFAELHRVGFLTDSSTVWVNAEAPDASFWALTDRSQYVCLHRSTEPGYVRLTTDRMRWARSYDATLERYELDLATSTIGTEPDKRITLIIKHRVPGRTVKVIDRSALVTLTDGKYVRNNLHVIDLAAYRAPTPAAEPSEYEVSHARYHGVAHLIASLDTDNADLVRNHLGMFAFDITAEQLNTINGHLDVVEQFADSFGEALYARLAGVAAPTP